MIHISAYIAAGIDFSDADDIPEDVSSATHNKILVLRDTISGYLEDNRSGERVRDGLKVVIAGPPNAGKSSLLNYFAKRDVAIVSEKAGTTRDVLEVHLDLGGFPVTIMDTAGLREIDDIVEEEGVRRALARVAEADVVLWTTDSSVDEEKFECDIDSDLKLIRVRNKIDLGSIPNLTHSHLVENDKENVHFTSVKSGVGLDDLVSVIASIASEYLSIGDNVVITRARHREALSQAVSSLSEILADPLMPDELVAEGLRVSGRELGRVTGRVDVEDLLDVIFRDFCVGK